MALSETFGVIVGPYVCRSPNPNCKPNCNPSSDLDPVPESRQFGTSRIISVK